MTHKRAVLVLNDSVQIQAMIKACICHMFDVLEATTLAEGQTLYEENRERIELIVVDGSVENPNTVDTIPFVQRIRDEYKGILLAASQNPDSNSALMDAGCHYSITESGADPVINLVPTIKKLLGIK